MPSSAGSSGDRTQRVWFCASPSGRLQPPGDACRRPYWRVSLQRFAESATNGRVEPVARVWACRGERRSIVQPVGRACPTSERRVDLRKEIQLAGVGETRADLRLCLSADDRIVFAQRSGWCSAEDRLRTLRSLLPDQLRRSANRFCFFVQHAALVDRIHSEAATDWLVHGASILSGYTVGGIYGEGEYQSSPLGAGRQIASQMTARYGPAHAQVRVTGSAGATSRDLLHGGFAQGPVNSLAAELATSRADVVLLNLNSNDATRLSSSAAEFITNIESLVTTARSAGAYVLVVPPFEHFIPRPEYALYESHVQVVARYLDEEPSAALPIATVLANPLAKGSARAGLTTDGVHPNATGAIELAEAATELLPTSQEYSLWRHLGRADCR